MLASLKTEKTLIYIVSPESDGPEALSVLERVKAKQALEPTHVLMLGDARSCLAGVPTNSVTAMVTSPPYLGLRSNGGEHQIYGGDVFCKHAWSRSDRPGIAGGRNSAKLAVKGTDNFQVVPDTFYEVCERCAAWKGELGAEPTVELYVEHVCEVFRALWPVCKSNATLWLNIGDAYSGSGKGPTGKTGFGNHSERQGFAGSGPFLYPGYKRKCLMGIPHKIADALQRDGWYLRDDVIWNKPDGLSHPVTDRPVRTHEYLYMLTKSDFYFYDYFSMREPTVDGKSLRNIRSVWSIGTAGTKLAHSSAFPEPLVERCIRASSAAGDIVLDPFGGSGTVSAVAAKLGRSSVYIDTQAKYLAQARERLEGIEHART